MNGKAGQSKSQRKAKPAAPTAIKDKANDKTPPIPKDKVKKTTTASLKTKPKISGSGPRRSQRRKAGVKPGQEDDEFLPPGLSLPRGVTLDSDSLSARQPVDPAKEPIRAAALLEGGATSSSQKYLCDAAEWRAGMERRCLKWIGDHAEEIHTNRLRHQFSAWVELEADPDYFTIMLKRLGIERAKVVEVHTLDDMLSNHHCLKYGIMFLSKYHDDGIPCHGEIVPPDLWFSNQVVDNACATVAILNIVNNVKTLDTGENLDSFRCFSESFSPEMRGEALANFEWCRSIHNAFAKMTEMLVSDLALKREVESVAGKSRGNAKPKSKPTSTIKPSTINSSKTNKKEDTPNHYVAYVPVAGSVWKLDGLRKYPRNLGPLTGGEAWVNTVRDDIQKQMALFPDDGSVGYTVLAIVEDKLPSLIEMLGRSINHFNWIEHCISEKRDYWNRSIANEPKENRWEIGNEPIRGADFRYDLTDEILEKKTIAMTAKEKDDMLACSEEHLKAIRPDVVATQIRLRELIVPLKEEREAQWIKYKDRMFDYGPVIHQWLKFLEENGAIGPLIEWHLQHPNGSGNGNDQAGFDYTN